MSINSQDIYAEIQSRFETALKAGTIPWRKPWVGAEAAPRNLQSNKPYRGINALLLGLSDYSDPRWTTFNAARKMGANVRKGEKSTLVTLWKRISIKDADAPNGKKIIPILRYFRVFNVEQIDWPDGTLPELSIREHPEGWDGNMEAEAILRDYLASTNAPTLSYGGNSAHYAPAKHAMKLPVAGDFWTADGFYGIAFHECAHSTGHRAILNREPFAAFGSERYAREELTAEMAAAFVCATIGIDGGFDNSVAYIQTWLKAIQNDPKILVTAAGKAQKAADRILGTLIEYDQPELDKTEAVV